MDRTGPVPAAQTAALVLPLHQGQGHDGPPPITWPWAPGTGHPSPPFPSFTANYSVPVVSALSGSPQDKELTFTCTSWGGYPRPNVYWINKTDNSLLDEALQNSTVSVNALGLYDVVSVLRVPWVPNLNVDCCIENVLLLQNLTVSSQTETGKVPGLHADPEPRLCTQGVLAESLKQKTKSQQGDPSVASVRCLEGRGEDSLVRDDEITHLWGRHGVGCSVHTAWLNLHSRGRFGGPFQR